MIGVKWSVGGEVKSVSRWNQRHRTRLLAAGEDDVYRGEICRSTQDAAFRGVVAGQDPQTVLYFVVHAVVDVTDGAGREGIGNVPGSAGIERGVDVDFIASGIIEVFAPIKTAVRCGRDGQ